MARDRPSPYDEGGLPPRPREARRPIASRPGGLSYRDFGKRERVHRDRDFGKWGGDKEDGSRKKKKWRIPDLNW